MTRRVVVFCSVLSVIVTGFALLASGGAAMAAMKAPALPATTGTWGNAEPVPGLPAGIPNASVTSMSCTAPGECSAGGFLIFGNSPGLAFVVNESGGIWAKVQYVAGASGRLQGGAVTSVSCASPGNCSAGGYYGTVTSQAFIVNETDGTWGKAVEVPGMAALNRGASYIYSVSCTAVGDCSAGGDYNSSTNEAVAFVVDEKDGTWGTALPLPSVAGLAGTDYNAGLNSVSCASPGNCAAGGWAQDATSSQAFVVDETGGVWGSATEVPGSAALNIGGNAMVTSVSCTAVGDCAVGGSYAAESSAGTHYMVYQQAFVADETGGTWGDATEVPGTAALNVGDDAQVNSVSCTSPGNCAAGGVYSTRLVDARAQAAFRQAFVVNETDGVWDNAQEVLGASEVDSVSCALPGGCVAGGDRGDLLQSQERAVVVDETNGSWGAARNVPGMTAINTAGPSYVTAVSCVSVTDCAAGGTYDFGSSGNISNVFVVVKSVHQPTATVVKLSAPKVAYGNERAEHVSVSVTAGAGGFPAGTVTVTSGSTTACTITLASGKGSCAPSATRFPAGLVRLTASYRGSFSFGTSVSSAAGFTVVKAATKTRLSLSAAKVAYGHEQSEKLSVSVSPRYAGTVVGKVTVKAGQSTVCVITLKSGKGACTLAGRKLPAGRYALTATYRGSKAYVRSTATKKTLSVVS